MKYKIYRCNCRKLWSVQSRKEKFTAESILLNGKWNTELKSERRLNPRGFVITNHTQDIIPNPPIELVNQFTKTSKLIYDKNSVDFNIKFGEYLFFANDGTCYLLKKES
ncbi:hypothetical protein [Neobacillus mesonae]|uniref:hypothetical protein n=1 Tax=Neobacillus mesonae TaxID=1193713 RepID=UPI00203C2865|nr:hypothetical protein [Neobacillus mesonae]MCM3571429.1 hypothetical protein [Neobacillus mesonae]